MADSVFRASMPTTKAHDNGDGTYSLAVSARGLPVGGTDITVDSVYMVLPGGLKARDLGDGTYAVSVKAV